jgi:ABC-type glycerol-3-phosphate transport system substrate-binding protein
MPAGCSLELNQKGEVIRKGTKTITTGGWWWGIPKETPDPRLSYALARYITTMENQVKECSNFGMIPVRKEVLTDMQMLFGGQWISQIYEVSFRQLMQNRFTTVPAHPRMDEIGNVYLAAWDDIVVKKNWSADTVVPDREFIKRRIYNIYGKRIEEIK